MSSLVRTGCRKRGTPVVPRGGTRGFTLLELLLAITLLGLVALMLAGGLRLGARVWDAGAEDAELASEIEAVQGFLRQHLAGAHPLRLAHIRSTRPQFAFEGDRRRLRFAALAPPQFGVGGFYIVTVELVRREKGDDLLLTAALYHPEMPEDLRSEDQQETVLLEGVDDLEIEYYGSLRREDPPAWLDRWEEQPRPPLLVRLTVAFPRRDRRRWPEFVVAPEAQR